MKVPVWPFYQPFHHGRRLVDGIVIQDQVHLFAERLNQEIKRRTRVARIFPNTDSLLRPATAVLSEISVDWESLKLTST